MKNSIICTNCASENPNFKQVCSNCKSYLREKVYNIDIWNTISLLIESPSKALQQIVFSEHKNLAAILVILFSIRVFVLSKFVSILFDGSFGLNLAFTTSFIITFTVVCSVILFYTFFLSKWLNNSEYVTRFKDIFAVTSYSQIPNLFVLFFVFPIELIVFGATLFSNNPAAFEVKPLFFFTFLAFEFGLIIWSMLLNYLGMKVITGSTKVSYSITLSFFLLFILILLSLGSIV